LGTGLSRTAALRVVSEPAVRHARARKHHLRVPDLGVTCTPDAPGQQTLPDPVLLIEILSPGNTSDTWDNVGPTPPSRACARSSSCIRRACSPRCCGAAPTATGPRSPRMSGGRALRLEAIQFACPLSDIYARRTSPSAEGTGYCVEAQQLGAVRPRNATLSSSLIPASLDESTADLATKRKVGAHHQLARPTSAMRWRTPSGGNTMVRSTAAACSPMAPS